MQKPISRTSSAKSWQESNSVADIPVDPFVAWRAPPRARTRRFDGSRQVAFGIDQNTSRQSAVLEERNRLAGEIHDSLAQNFAGISMQLLIAAEKMQMKSEDTLSHVERAIDLARFGLSEARRSALSLRSDIIEESGLTEALKKLVEHSHVPGLLRCSFRSSKVSEESLAPWVQQDLLRIAQEAISNALRHASQRSSASVCAGIHQILCSKSEITALESLRAGQARKDWDLPICGHGQRILAPNWTSVAQPEAAPVSSFVYRSFHENFPERAGESEIKQLRFD